METSKTVAEKSAFRILIVDDEELMCELLQFNLVTDGYSVDVCYSAEEALKHDLMSYNLFILDIMMGEMSGINLARIIKGNSQTAHIPIIFCSAKSREDDVIEGLNSGADDYVTKPFSMREMVARVSSVFRRQNAVPAERLVYGGLVVDLFSSSVDVDGETVPFTRTEFDMLAFFLKNKNKFFSRNEILDNVWTKDVVVTDRTIDVNISRIRKKMGRYASNLVNRSGFGYGFVE